MQENHPHPNYRIFIALVALLAIGIWFISIYLYRLKKEREEIPVVAVPAVVEVSPAVTTFPVSNAVAKLATTSVNVATGRAISVSVNLDSDARDVVGYDVLVSYDPDVLTFSSAVSTVPTFTVIPVSKEGLVSLTGTKNPLATGSSVLNAADVARLTFVSKNKGETKLSIVQSSDKQKTQIIDSSLNKLYPKISSVTVNTE